VAKSTFVIKEAFADWKRIGNEKAAAPGFSHISWGLPRSMKGEMAHDPLDIIRMNVRLSR
jgi:hypothetical protein